MDATIRMELDPASNENVASEIGDSARGPQEQFVEPERISAARSESFDSRNAATSSSSLSSNRPQVRQWWKFKLRPPEDEEDQ